MQRWKFWIDRGGTFTDCIGLEPGSGELRVAKILSSDQAPLAGIRQVLGLGDQSPIPPCEVRMGTTVATNALLERRGRDCALLITRGFADLLEIGTQARPQLFELNIQKPHQLYRTVVEIESRATHDGRALAREPAATFTNKIAKLGEQGVDSVAICVLHGYAAPELELELAEIATAAGMAHVVTSHHAANQLGFLKRSDTAVLDAYLTPLLSDYLNTLKEALPGSELLLMQSSGELALPQYFRGPASLLSGPAGGVVASAKIAQMAGAKSAICFDMGGTSTDVSRFENSFNRVYESHVAGVRVLAPMLDIHTVAAGGGSLCRYDGYRLKVGPESAGALPGPLCYGHIEATELTVTDINFFLGRLQADRFPFPLNVQRVRSRLLTLQTELSSRGQELSLDEIAWGFLRIANDSMAQAIRQVSQARGFDVREDALVVFGGAGGQHACAIAAELGVTRLFLHPLAGVLSAYGMGLSDVGWHGQRDAGGKPMAQTHLGELQTVFDELESRGRRALGAQHSSVSCERQVELRYQGADTCLVLDVAPEASLVQRFDTAHERAFGWCRQGHPLELVVIRVSVTAKSSEEARAGGYGGASSASFAAGPGSRADTGAPLEPRRHAQIWTNGCRRAVPIFDREQLAPGSTLTGPACINEATGSLLLDDGFLLTVAADGLLRVTAAPAPPSASTSSGGTPAPPESIEVDSTTDTMPSTPDPIHLELMSNAFMSIAEQMGAALRQTALSTNIRERLDFSCAVFDSQGELLANAPHIPVHLGAMSESVKDIAAAHPGAVRGDVFATNDPAHGGSHLPDITVVTPVFNDSGQVRFFVACRGHHADVGGSTPGSMPPHSTTLSEEGIVLRAVPVVRAGQFLSAELTHCLSGGPYPARNIQQNLGDLRAQTSANHLGVRLLAELCAARGEAFVLSYAQHIQDHAADRVRELLASLGETERYFEDQLDDGTRLAVSILARSDDLHIRLAGTPEHAGNSNAPRAVSVAAVMYVLRCLLGGSLPLNGGCMRNITLQIPSGTLLDPSPNRAVASGNVETSQRVVDILLGALGAAAASQGTMNNLTFGNSDFGYYETIGGGAGAGPGFAGASAVHTHMTNTRITDPEVLESRYPVRLRHFGVRRGSGGDGLNRGGDGIVRELEFLAPLQGSLVSERRVTVPFGLEGGKPGASGINTLDGAPLPGRCALKLTPGCVLRIETPGGGGFGQAL